MRTPRFTPAVVRIQVQPDRPDAIVAPRPRGSRRPHKDATAREVRRLVEKSTLTYGEIAARTGVGRASICRWTRDQGWKRPLFAPRATDTVPRERASARLRARTLAARLHALSERYVRELEETPGIDLTKLGEALELMKIAKLAVRPKQRTSKSLAPAPTETPSHLSHGERSPDEAMLRPAGEGLEPEGESEAPHPVGKRQAAKLAADAEWILSKAAHESARAAVLEGLQAAGVNLDRVPQAAVEDFIASRMPPKLLPGDDPALRARGHRSRRNREHAWLLRKD